MISVTNVINKIFKVMLTLQSSALCCSLTQGILCLIVEAVFHLSKFSLTWLSKPIQSGDVSVWSHSMNENILKD